MKIIKYKNPTIVMPEHEVLVKEVKVEAENGGYIVPNVARTDKEMSFGEVIFAHDERYIGKFILIDPWRQTPVSINGEKFIMLHSENGFSVIEESK